MSQHHLDPEQQVAVTAPIGADIVIAGPGSGKTRVINARIAHLIGAEGVPPSSIAAFTFTNQAARELTRRLRQTLGRQQAQQLTAGTFHSWAARFLRERHEAAAVPVDYTIYDREDSIAVLGQIGDDDSRLTHPELRPPGVMAYISRQKSLARTPEREASLYPPTDTSPQAVRARIWAEYENRLRRQHALDFDDLLLRTLICLRRNPEILDQTAARHRHLLIDEYQDTNGVQQNLATLLVTASDPPSLFVVGDPDQSIYAFRNAHLEGFLRFGDRYREARQYHLTHNYRSTECIINAAQSLISHNEARIPRDATITRPSGTKTAWIEAPDPEAEAAAIGDRLLQHPAAGEWRHFCIAYRTHAQSYPLAKALRERQIPFVTRGDFEFFRRQEVKAYLAWLRLALNAYDEAALRTASQAPRSGIGPATWQKLSQTANAADYSVTTVLNEIHHRPAAYPDVTIRPQELKAIAAFCERLHDLWDRADEYSPHQILTHLRDRTGLGRWTDGLHNTTDRKANIADLFNLADEDRYPPGNLSQFLEDIATTAAESRAGDQNLPRVTLTTLHQAKGLEFPHVLVAGAEAGLLPHRMSQTPSELEEERRLFYVGITRAEDSLTVSWCRKRNNRPTKPSPFLAQIAPDCWQTPLPRPGNENSDDAETETDDEPTPAVIRDTANRLAQQMRAAVDSLKARPDLSERLTAAARVNWPAIRQSPTSRSPAELAQALTASAELAKLLSATADDAPGDVRPLTKAHRLCVTLSRYYRRLGATNGARNQ